MAREIRSDDRHRDIAQIEQRLKQLRLHETCPRA
jgi:hypothetical protein